MYKKRSFTRRNVEYNLEEDNLSSRENRKRGKNKTTKEPKELPPNPSVVQKKRTPSAL